jgi:NitT/TauT family transport system permease protein
MKFSKSETSDAQHRGAMRRLIERVLKIALPILFGVALIAAWHLAVVATETKVVPGPWKVVVGMGQLNDRGVLIPYVLASLRRVAIGYLIAVVLGVPLGLWMGLSLRVFAAANPLVQILRPISPIAWIPIAIVLFGIGEAAPVFLIALAGVLPIASSVATHVRTVPPMYLAAARNFGLSTGAIIWRVLFPAVLPRMLSSLRLALGVCWIVVVAAEMIAVDSGLGYLIIDSRNAGKRYDLVVAGMVLVGAIGLILDLSFRGLERMKSVRWGFRQT